jgi:hypothetical protein
MGQVRKRLGRLGRSVVRRTIDVHAPLVRSTWLRGGLRQGNGLAAHETISNRTLRTRDVRIFTFDALHGLPIPETPNGAVRIPIHVVM